MKIALTIAGSDSGGGAGIQADLKTFHAFGVFGTSVVTAITAQNTLGVRDVHPVPVDTVTAQISAVMEDLPPAAAKTGMLATRTLLERVARMIDETRMPNVVVDPVMVASSGDRLLDRDAERAIIDEMMPRAALVTPNVPEAEILCGRTIEDEDDLQRAAEALVERGAASALVKGGHLDHPAVVNVLHDGTRLHVWRMPRHDTRNTHGTGCTLSAAVTAQLALGAALPEAVAGGLDFVGRAIRSAPDLGQGHGPLNHCIPASPGTAPA